jgi:small subunit ribosomal protein S4
MGFAPTRRGARQLVTHGHVRLNGKKISIPSYICSVGDAVSIKEISKKLNLVNAHDANVKPIGFVNVDYVNKSGTFTRLPERSELNQNIKETYVIEYYNRLM